MDPLSEQERMQRARITKFQKLWRSKRVFSNSNQGGWKLSASALTAKIVTFKLPTNFRSVFETAPKGFSEITGYNATFKKPVVRWVPGQGWIGDTADVKKIIAKRGQQTIVFTDTLQTACMLGGLLICVFFLMDLLKLDLSSLASTLVATDATRVWNTDPASAGFWLKQIVGGAFIAIAMTGLDQEMMQKNISVPNLRDSQKNMVLFSLVLVLVNLLFLILGALLYLFAQAKGISATGDQIFPTVVMQYFPQWVQIIFFIALISALFPSADGALTALTSSFCIDILGIRKQDLSEGHQTKIRHTTHVIFALMFFVIVMIFKWIDDRSIIDTILKIAGYTYGPLLGLFAFGMLTKRTINNNVGLVGAAFVAPLICWILQRELAKNPGGYQIGIELLLINGALTFVLLWMISQRPPRLVAPLR
jgi:Na+/proline symporter